MSSTLPLSLHVAYFVCMDEQIFARESVCNIWKLHARVCTFEALETKNWLEKVEKENQLVAGSGTVRLQVSSSQVLLCSCAAEEACRLTR